MAIPLEEEISALDLPVNPDMVRLLVNQVLACAPGFLGQDRINPVLTKVTKQQRDAMKNGPMEWLNPYNCGNSYPFSYFRIETAHNGMPFSMTTFPQGNSQTQPEIDEDAPLDAHNDYYTPAVGNGRYFEFYQQIQRPKKGGGLSIVEIDSRAGRKFDTASMAKTPGGFGPGGARLQAGVLFGIKTPPEKTTTNWTTEFDHVYQATSGVLIVQRPGVTPFNRTDVVSDDGKLSFGTLTQREFAALSQQVNKLVRAIISEQ